MNSPATTPRSSGSKVLLNVVLPLVMVAAGGALTYFTTLELLHGRQSVSWPTAPGKIEKSKIEEQMRGGEHPRTEYDVAIQYVFKVDDAEHHGRRVAYGDGSYSLRSDAEEVINRYPVGREVTVYYQPGQPDQCALEPGAKLLTYLFPLVGLFMAACGLVLYLSWRTPTASQ